MSRGEKGDGVLVLATEFRAGPWVCRSLAAAGFRVVGAHPLGAGGRSMACPRPLRYPSPVGDPDGFVEAVRTICRDRSIAAVFPVSEDALRIIAEREPDLAGAEVAGPSRDQYARLCDKGLLGASAARAGVAHPETVVVPQGGQVPAWPPLPSVVKPRVAGESLEARPVAIVTSAAQRTTAVAELHEQGLEPIVQELVVGRRWSVHGARGRGFFRACAIEIQESYPRGAGTSSVSRSVPPPPHLLECARSLLELVDYRGPCSFNFIERDGTFLVHDVNLRVSDSVGLSIRSGLDVPRLGLEAALGIADPAEQSRGRSFFYVSSRGELAALLDGLRGRGAGEDSLRIAGRLAHGVASPRGIADPFPLDPFWVGSRLARRGSRLAHQAGRLVSTR